MILEYVNYILRARQTKWKYSLFFIHSGRTWTFGWNYTPCTTVCAWFIVHPMNIHMRHYSSQYSLQLFKGALLLENVDIVHNIPTIQTDIIHYSYQRTFLPIFWVSSHENNTPKARMLNIQENITMQLNNVMIFDVELMKIKRRGLRWGQVSSESSETRQRIP